MGSKLLDEIKQYLPEYNTIGFSWYGWIRGSYIPWHGDGQCKIAATIYLNEYWDENWGGYFAYEDGVDIKCIKPQYNRMTLIKPPIRHTVFNTSSIAPIRETIQIFVK
jgi:Rps23 Pro-64 3,4-dihydroxylase Tpa1-like proline 4-hydroxylase